MTTNNDYHLSSWKFNKPTEELDIHAVREGNKLLLKGTSEGEEVDKEFELSEEPWLQVFPVNPGLEEFITSDKEHIKFWMVGLKGPGKLKCTKFVAKKKANEQLQINGESVKAVRVKITFDGMMSALWSAKAWFRESDGRYLKSEMPGHPGHCASEITLVKEMIQ
jgi:hypothetical protein